MTELRQAELITEACKEAGLYNYIRWIDYKNQAGTWAEKIAIQFKGSHSLPVKNSYMYCETLDMCFFYSQQGIPMMTYAGYVTADSEDFMDNKIQNAFSKAEEVLNIMKRLAEAEEE